MCTGHVCSVLGITSTTSSTATGHHAVLGLHHFRADVCRNPNQSRRGAAGSSNGRERRPVVARRADEDHPVPVHEVFGQLHEAPGVGGAASLPVRKVDHVAAQSYRLDHGPGQRRASLHAAQAGVPDLETDNVGAGSHAADDVVARVAALDLLVVGGGGGGGMVTCSDAGHVRPVRTGIDDDAQDGAIIVDVDGVVEHAHVSHGLVLPLFGEVRHGPAAAQIAALGHIDDGPVVRPVPEHHAVHQRTRI